MSRIGKKPVPVPAGVSVEVNGRDVSVKGPKGELAWQYPEGISVRVEDTELVVENEHNAKSCNALHGLTRSLVNNMVIGVSSGYEKVLDIIGVGYRAKLDGKVLELLLGYSHPIRYAVPEGIEIKVVSPTQLAVKGISKEQVGQVAADIRGFRPPEPYKGKGVKYRDEVLRRKVGKSGAKK